MQKQGRNSQETIVPPWGRVLVPQGIYIVIHLWVLQELRPHPGRGQNADDYSPQFSSVQSFSRSLSRIRLFATPWIRARQASLSITSSRSLPKLMPIESVMPSSHLILCCHLLLLPPIPPSIRVFSNESPEIKLPASTGSLKKQESSRKTSTSALLTMLKTWSVWIKTKCGKFLKRWEYQTTWPAFWEICMQVRKQQLELDMERQTGSNMRKEYIEAVYCYSAYFTYMQSTSSKMLG